MNLKHIKGNIADRIVIEGSDDQLKKAKKTLQEKLDVTVSEKRTREGWGH